MNTINCPQKDKILRLPWNNKLCALRLTPIGPAIEIGYWAEDANTIIKLLFIYKDVKTDRTVVTTFCTEYAEIIGMLGYLDRSRRYGEAIDRIKSYDRNEIYRLPENEVDFIAVRRVFHNSLTFFDSIGNTLELRCVSKYTYMVRCHSRAHAHHWQRNIDIKSTIGHYGT